MLLSEVYEEYLRDAINQAQEKDSAGDRPRKSPFGRGYCLTMSSSSTSNTKVAPGLITGGDPRSP